MRKPSHKSSAAHEPQRQRGRERVAALVAAGAAVFGEKGYDGATMTAIAARAGAAIGSLYQFFPTKEAIAEAVHADAADRLLAILRALAAETAGASPDRLADRLYDAFFAFLEANPAFVTLADRPPDPGKSERRAAMRGCLAGLFTAMDPPREQREAEGLAVVVLHLMRVAVAVNSEADVPNRQAVMGDLRAMVHRLLAAGEAPPRSAKPRQGRADRRHRPA